MVAGSSSRALAAVIRLNKNVKANNFSRNIRASVRAGKSVNQFVKDLRVAGISTSRNTVTSYLVGSLSSRQLSNYNNLVTSRFGTRAAVDLPRLSQFTRVQDPLFRVKFRRGKGKIEYFDVRINDGLNLTSKAVEDLVREIYETDEHSPDSKLAVISTRILIESIF